MARVCFCGCSSSSRKSLSLSSPFHTLYNHYICYCIQNDARELTWRFNYRIFSIGAPIFSFHFSLFLVIAFCVSKGHTHNIKNFPNIEFYQNERRIIQNQAPYTVIAFAKLISRISTCIWIMDHDVCILMGRCWWTKKKARKNRNCPLTRINSNVS